MSLVGYNLEYASVPAGPWTRLCRIDLEPGHLIYFAFNSITKAIPIRLDRQIDQFFAMVPCLRAIRYLVGVHGIVLPWRRIASRKIL
jgi:hypothetical protein